LVLAFGRSAGVERISPIAELRKPVDEASRFDLAVTPFDRNATIGQIHACSGGVRDRRETALDCAHAAAAGDSLDGKFHPGDAAIEVVDEIRKIALQSSDFSVSRK
jgi:hypothetical protein